MPINYNTIKKQCALKLAQLIGTDQSTLEASYAGSWASVLDGAEIPITAFRDQILMVEKTFAEAIGDNPAHPARSLLYGVSAELSDGDQLPNTDAGGKEWVGVFDSVIDADDGKALTAQPVQTIADLNQSFFADIDVYNYAMFGNNIFCTRPGIKLQGCIWDLAAQTALYASSGDSPLPQYLANGWVSGVVGMSPQIGWADASGAFQIHMNIYQEALASIASPGTGVPLTAAMNTAAG